MNVEASSPGVQITGVTPDGNYLTAVIPSSGHWNFIKGAHGQGEFYSETNLILSFAGHVVAITGGSVTLTGQWQP